MKRNVDQASHRSLVESAAKLLARYFIGFVNLKVRGGEADASIGGSGTLVLVGETRGVLTAGHVIRSIMQQEVVGIAIASNTLQRIIFKTNYCKPIEFLGKVESDGPDLGFWYSLRIPPVRWKRLCRSIIFRSTWIGC